MVAEEKNDSHIETAEELEAEKEHLAEAKEDEIRDSIISEYGFDPEEDKERVDKLVARELSHKKNLSVAIKQKIGYRSKLGGDTSTKNPAKPDSQKEETPSVSDAVNQALEKERLEDMPYSDDIKEVIKQVASINKVSVKKAVNDPYVQSRIEQWKKDTDADEAALGRKDTTGKGGKGGDSDELVPPDFDLSTEEGRKDYDKWKGEMIAKGY